MNTRAGNEDDEDQTGGAATDGGVEPTGAASERAVNHAKRRYTDYLDHLVTRPGLGVVISLVLLFMWLPMLVIVMYSFSGSGTIRFPPQSWTLDYYLALLAPGMADVTLNQTFSWSVVTTSLQIGVVTATVVVVLGTMSGYAINNYDLPGKEFFQTVSLLPIVVPLIVSAIGLLIFFSVVGIELGLGATVIAHVIYTFPFGVIIITSSIARVDTSLEEAASDLGSSEFRVFRKVTLPLISPGIFSAWILAFTLSLNEFVLTFFVSGTFLETLPMWMWDQLRFGVSPLTYVVSSLTLFGAVLLILLVHRLIGIRRVRG
jgi:spermidine/putrescine transport system permease protein